MPLAVRRLLLGAVATALALLAAEGLLRLLDPGQRIGRPRQGLLVSTLGPALTVPDDELLLRLRPDTEFLDYYRVNSRGWRGAELALAAPPDTLRVVAMGDSCTFGFGVNEQEAWPARLQAMLELAFADSLQVQVVNLGVPGYSTWQNRQQLRLDVPALSPDVIVLLPSGHNDITGAKLRSDRAATAYNHSLRAVLERTRVFRLLAGPSPEDDPEVPLPGVPGVTWRVSPEESRENLAAFLDGAQALGAGCVLVAPVLAGTPVPERPAYEAFAALVTGLAAERGVPLADPRPVFGQHPPDTLFVDPVHPDAEGQAWIAFQVLGALLQEDDLLPEVPRRAALRRWWRARSEGLDAFGAAGFTRHGPPGLASAWEALGHVDATLRPAPEAPDAVLRFDPLYGSAWSPRAAALTLRSRVTPDAAQAAREAALSRDAAAFLVPDDPFARLLAADRPSAERLALARALVIFERTLGVPSAPHDLRVGAAEDALARGETARAVELLEAARALQPDDPRVLQALGSALRQAGERARASAVFEHLITVAPDSPRALTHRARGALAAGRSDEAEALLRSALAVHPAYGDARYLLGRLLLDRGDLDGALEQLASARAFAAKLTYPDIPELLARIERGRRSGDEP